MLDVIEPFRHLVVDRFVLRAINLRKFNQKDFRQQPPNACLLNPQSIRKLIGLYEQAMQSPPNHWPTDLDNQQPTVRQAIEAYCRQLAQKFKKMGAHPSAAQRFEHPIEKSVMQIKVKTNTAA